MSAFDNPPGTRFPLGKLVPIFIWRANTLNTTLPTIEAVQRFAKTFPKEVIAIQTDSGGSELGFLFQGIAIADPNMSECSRFAIDPAYYGLTAQHAQDLKEINLAVQEAVEDAVNAGCKKLQSYLGLQSGDVAGHYFSGESTNKLQELFVDYCVAEIEDLRMQPIGGAL